MCRFFQCNVSPGFSSVSRLGHNVSTSGVDVANFVLSGSLLCLSEDCSVFVELSVGDDRLLLLQVPKLLGVFLTHPNK